ncbi:MAG: hypothetical protein JSV51_01330 [Candidatus Bathyarchaeota archaeon]|nr:MAG: hypothetical protein JSV51_01330 [Candidatus Bathyarchaeota archaeon]
MRVLFVCTGNAYRSPVAEALLKNVKPDIKADSAGIDPGIPISEAAKKYLINENAQKYLKSHPEGLVGKNLISYDLIVAMESKHKEVLINSCPQCAEKIVVWNIDDPYFLPHGYAEKIFNQIKEKVTKLVNSL